nr:immunoglobulin heavy chain junction region [Macaca mulatta]
CTKEDATRADFDSW